VTAMIIAAVVFSQGRWALRRPQLFASSFLIMGSRGVSSRKGVPELG
jgi:hypothetical protein